MKNTLSHVWLTYTLSVDMSGLIHEKHLKIETSKTGARIASFSVMSYHILFYYIILYIICMYNIVSRFYGSFSPEGGWQCNRRRASTNVAGLVLISALVRSLVVGQEEPWQAEFQVNEPPNQNGICVCIYICIYTCMHIDRYNMRVHIYDMRVHVYIYI